MATVTLPIATGFYVSQSLPLSAQECLNWYPSIAEAPALSQEVLFGTPGLVQIATSGSVENANRGIHEMDGIPYVVNGGKLYRVDETIVGDIASYSLFEIGNISGSGMVSMADNGTQLMILVPGGDGYIYNKSTATLSTITDVDFTANGDPQYVVFVDSYFVCTTDSKKFICSAPNDGTSWNALDYGSAESDPDVIVAPIVFRNQLFIAGSQTIEAFQNIGGADFPFQRTGLFLQKGVFAPASMVVVQSTFMWVGGGENEGPGIWALSGNDTQKVSTIPIDNILQDLPLSQLEGIFAWTYSQNGAYFVGFTLPSTTLVFDMTSKRWHERKSSIDGELVGFRPSGMCKAYNKILCADQYEGIVGEVNPDVYTEYGSQIIRRVVTQPFQSNMKSIFVPSIEMTVESGVGNTDATDPQISMERSVDGKTWSDPRARSMGKIGEYNRRAIWRRNGRAARFELFRFTMTDPVKPVLLQLTADVLPGDK